LGIAWAVDAARDSAVAEVGEPAPDFAVELLGGGTFRLAEHVAEDGRPLIINLWASWCLPCREEMPDLSNFAEANPGTAIIGVAVEDTIDDATAFGEEIDPVYPLAFGNADFDEAYPNFGLPVTYFLDEAGVVTTVHNGILTSETIEEIAGA
jgi:cytochrome c biogenesis protein CcmG/thiol:disulfide interchange protein DsbE